MIYFISIVYELADFIARKPILYGGAALLFIALLVLVRLTLIGGQSESTVATLRDLDVGDCVEVSEFSQRYVNVTSVSCDEQGPDIYRFDGYRTPGIPTSCPFEARIAGTVDILLCLSPN
jgi:hypothetical protein